MEDPVPVPEGRPRRSIVPPSNERYWGVSVNQEDETAPTASGSRLMLSKMDTTTSDDEFSYSSDDSEEDNGNEAAELDQEAFEEYLNSRSPAEVQNALKLKEEQRKTRKWLSDLNERSRNQHCVRDRNFEVETYFEAILRPKYRKTANSPKKTMTPGKTGSERGKKPRKGNRTGVTANDKLPEKPEETISVSKEIQNLDPNMTCNWIVSSDQEKIMEQRREEIKKDFPEWMFLLKEGFNIMLHGYGSKAAVFEDFKSFVNDKYLVIYFNGLIQKKLSARNFLIDLCRALRRNIKICGSNLELLAEEVRNVIEAKPCAPVFFLVKNLEHLANKNSALFQVLCVLAQVKFIHLIASCDHINSFAGVDPSSMIDLNFWWNLCPTYAPYEEELSHLPGVFGQEQENNNKKSSLQHIFKSLTANARKAFIVLADLQISALAAPAPKDKRSKKKGATTFEGIQFRDLVRRCQQNFIAHSDQTVKTLLVEYIDHHLISYTGKKSSMETVTISLDVEALQEFLKSQKMGI